MKLFLTLLILFLVVILQTSLMPFLTFHQIGANLVLVLILVWVIFKSFKKIWLGLLLVGLFLDFFSGLPFGLISLSLMTTAFLIDKFNRSVFSIIKFWVVIILVVLGTLIYDLLLIGLAKLGRVDLTANLKYLLIEIIYNLILAALFYGIKKILQPAPFSR